MSLVKKIIFVLGWLTSAALVGCGGSGGGASAERNLGAVAATGAPLALVPYRITQLDGTLLLSGQVDGQAQINAQLNVSQAPFLVEVTDTGVAPPKTYASLVLPSDVVDGKVAMNVTPLTTLVWQVVKNSRTNTTPPSDLLTLRNSAADAVFKAMQPLFQVAGSKINSGAAMLTTLFVPTTDPLDKVLDSLIITCDDAAKRCALKPMSSQAQNEVGTLTFDTSSLAKAQESATQINAKLAGLSNTKETFFTTSPVVVVFSAASTWGAAKDAWAGYTGKFTLYNFTDQAIAGGAQLYFESKSLKAQGFWDVTASVSDGKYAITLPSWGGMLPKKFAVQPSTAITYTFGFNGQGLPSDVKDFSSCNLNGLKCIILIDDGTLPVDARDSALQTRSWTHFLASLAMIDPNSLPAGFSLDPKNKNTALPPVTPNPDNSTARSGNLTPSGAATAAQVVLSATSRWDGGFNGELSLTNTSNIDWTTWRVSIHLPSSVTAIGGWGTYKLSTTGSQATFSNESWNGALASGKTIKLGFGGSGTLSGAATNCRVRFNDTAELPCTVSVSTGSDSTAPPSPPAAQPPAPAPTPPANLPPTPNATFNTSAADEPTTLSAAVAAVQNKRTFVGYYPSWADNWFSSLNWKGEDITNDALLAASKLARVPGTYTHVVLAFANPDFSWIQSTIDANSVWTGSGLNFSAAPQDIKRAIDVLHARNIKVLLAVGGATYNNWAKLAAENGDANGFIVNSLMKILLDLGLDGLEIDYEVEGINTQEYVRVVNSMRRAVDLAGEGRILSLAAWSTGSDCTPTTGTNACGGVSSFWGGKAGRERLVFSDATVAAKIDMVNIMSYDAGYENYDGVRAWQLYRDLFPQKTIVNIGLETAPEGWAGGQLVVEDSDAQCTGATLLKDQFGVAVNKPYSVHRYASAVTAARPNANPRDGAMLWQILKTANAQCGNASVASPGTVVRKISTLYGLPADNRNSWK